MRPSVNEVPPPNNKVPQRVPPIPNVLPEVQPEIPRNAEIPMAPVGGQVNLPPVREDLPYERFRRMKAPEFEGPTDTIVADNWLIDIQVILISCGLQNRKRFCVLLSHLRRMQGTGG
ncbi:hypothetical protein TIFTF001_032061 [Ficus carica]|uniref:Uncharacterized protein n=1 Tax=Ficus carica TaxID=3494 RepID=A0AA88DWQ9_FICCA|nr:hypothetical protein TIFTF001_032061 [Ficus carica]